LALVLAFLTRPGWAQVTLDGSLGVNGAVIGPHYRIPDTLGQRAGSNLFHSFGSFSIRESESATFTGPAGIANVISRVTGGQTSTIDGRLRSEIPKADVWLINPAGVAFGPKAQVDVPGALHVSTADDLRFVDGATFSATNPQAVALSAAPPEAFGFLRRSPAAIRMDGSQLEIAPEGAISLTGGDIVLGAGSVIDAPEGRFQATSLASPGAVDVRSGNVRDAVALGRFSMDTAALTMGSPARQPAQQSASEPRMAVIRAGEVVLRKSNVSIANGSP